MQDIELTPKEKQLFEFIEKYQMGHGSSPTVREMREHMKLKSDGFIIHCLKALEEKELIKKGDTPRSIKLLPKVAQKLSADTVKIPVLGQVPAGGPVLSEENVESWMTFESGQIKNAEKCFILKVRGDSMINAGIFEGDFVIASPDKAPRKGDVVVALVDGGSTVKKYETSGGKVYLKPENPRYENIYPEEDLQVQGVVVGMLRWY
ncbi:MAG: transcriptional repressor LexA [Candidatus Gracilibacteria bacterium]|jgi:repressor LexA